MCLLWEFQIVLWDKFWDCPGPLRTRLQFWEKHMQSASWKCSWGCSCFSSDEAHFHLNVSISKQNMRYWADSNPRKLHQRPLHSSKVTVCCAISSAGIIASGFLKKLRLQSDHELKPVRGNVEELFFYYVMKNWT